MHEQSNELEIAWAAGLFEGEGSISCSPTGGLRLKLGMTDGDVVQRFGDVVGCGSIYVREEMRQAHWKACWYWEVCKIAECRALMERLLPHLGERRTARWHEVLAFRKGLRPEQECPECKRMFKPIRRGQVTCGHPCSNRYFRRVGHFGGKARHTEEAKARISATHKRRNTEKR